MANNINVNDILDRFVIRLDARGTTEKVVTYIGYGYEAETNEGLGYRLVEYDYFKKSLDSVYQDINDYAYEHDAEYKQHITDCNKDELIKFYTDDNGELLPIVNEDDVNINTPDGYYIVEMYGRSFNEI